MNWTRTESEKRHLKNIAEAYFQLLTSVDWNNDYYKKGINEGLNKFLSNSYLGVKSANKYHKTHFITKEALARLEDVTMEKKRLIYEHLVPKKKYFQEDCMDKAAKNNIQLPEIIKLLDDYWWLATVTKEQDEKLNHFGFRETMPEDWDEVSPDARYTNKNIDIVLIDNPFFFLKDSA